MIDDGENGLLVPVRDHHAIALRVMDVLRDKAMGQALGRAASRKVRTQCSIKSMVSQYEALYDKCVRKYTANSDQAKS